MITIDIYLFIAIAVYYTINIAVLGICISEIYDDGKFTLGDLGALLFVLLFGTIVSICMFFGMLKDKLNKEGEIILWRKK